MLTSIDPGYGTTIMLPRLLRGLLLAPLGLRGSEIGPTKTKFERSSAVSVPRNTNEACTAHDVHKNLSPGMKSENLKLHYIGVLGFDRSSNFRTKRLLFVCKGVQAELLGVDREMDWMILLHCW
ncbi:hypothetical protein VNO77_17066 [Canavalia gladiata]|uniref:Uncharacterized protein n=1 Tax=Canavalia gladiata TaxID=3824 RepID=A0AAN9LLY4_CANGL